MKLRCKVLEQDGHTYLVGGALLASPIASTLTLWAMSDDDTKIMNMTVAEYNALPYFWFEQGKPAPKGEPVRPTTLPYKQ